jgi:hypothetical protein
MPSIFELKEQEITETPLLVFECTLPDGRVERWSTHRVTADGSTYEARVLQHNIFEMQAGSEQGVDGIPRISIVLANADSHCSEIERAVGWKGARLKVEFLFYDLRLDTAASETSVIFQGTCNPPDEIREGTFRVTASSRLNLQRLVLPQVRIQRRCPWEFPATETQRGEAVDGGESGKYSRFYRCGYSAGSAGGSGILKDSAPFDSCGYTRQDCQARGMFPHFGGIGFVPPAISVRTYGDKNSHTSAVAVNQTRYNDFVPMVYGTAWYEPPVVFARNDGNLTRMEALLGIGEIQGVLKVLVNDVEIPVGVAGTNMTATGWHNVMTLGTRAGVCDPDFTDGSGQPAGDPYGSMAYISVVVPNRLNDGTSLPRVKVLAQGLKLPTYAPDGSASDERFSANPAWVLLDVLRRMGWQVAEIDVASFAQAATYCDEGIDAVDLNGNAIRLPRFECNFVLQNRRSAGDLARGVRNSARLLLSYSADGKIAARVENAIATEMPVKPAWSNSTETLDGGWPSYEFGDGSSGISGMLRRESGEPSVRVFSRSVAETPNRYSVEFQDSLNEYQQDSFSVVDVDDVARSGQEVAATWNAIGIPNYDQAARVLKTAVDKSVRGNTYIEFETSVKAFGVRAGDLISVTYLKEGFNRQPFRVIRIAPGLNHRVTTITVQIHDDSWYADRNGQINSAGGRRQSIAGIGVPRPLMGAVLDDNADVQLGVEEAASQTGDGAEEVNVRVSFVPPAVATGAGPGIPFVNLTAEVVAGGTLAAGVLYYAVSGVDENGNEGGLSFVARAHVVTGGSSALLSGLSFAAPTASFHVYRGDTPAQLFRIASACPLSDHFTDTGLPKSTIPAPDANFDHANFYWRMELQPEVAATAHSATTIGNGTLQMLANGYRGATARITGGRGAGQERTIASNDATTLTVAGAWDIEPDATSRVAVSESSWKFGALSKTSPVDFTVPNRSGEVVQILGRAANVNDQEAAAQLSPMTRWQLGGTAGGTDSGAPPQPFFGLTAGRRGGTAELSGVSFTDLANTHSISSATLTLYYRDELLDAAGTLTSAMTSDAVTITTTATLAAGDLVQIGGEVLRVEGDGHVTRGALGTAISTHETGARVDHLFQKTAIAPFPAEFFGSPYSGTWSFPVALPDTRIACAELFVTNRKGNSEARAARFTDNDDAGLRTLSGGQYSIQTPGFLAIDESAAPPLVIEASHGVREIYGVLGTAADAAVTFEVRVNGAALCRATIAAGSTMSNTRNGRDFPPLRAGDRVTLALTGVGGAAPGADLTVLIRL